MAEEELPELLVAAFEGDEELLAWAMGLKTWMRREIYTIVMEPKSEDARVRRAERMAERLLSTMEAEKELPPMIASALRGTPKAMQGWKAMTANQRRLALLAIFRPVGMEGRERQLRQVVEACVAKAGKGVGSRE